MTALWITAHVQPLRNGGRFVRTDLSAQIDEFGSGVYTLVDLLEDEQRSTALAMFGRLGALVFDRTGGEQVPAVYSTLTTLVTLQRPEPARLIDFLAETR